jgi:hypothetical protein
LSGGLSSGLRCGLNCRPERRPRCHGRAKSRIGGRGKGGFRSWAGRGAKGRANSGGLDPTMAGTYENGHDENCQASGNCAVDSPPTRAHDKKMELSVTLTLLEYSLDAIYLPQ